ncbi:MAG: hypothetical protein JNK58_03675 [Phycisphaerae bacterium]|nr:hypothetical protein [Phycisphaerae bacterium]
MSRSFKGLLAAVASTFVCAAASAQIIAIPLVTWKYQQPWTKPWHSFASVVQSCQGNPVTFAPVAADDWICTASGPIVRVSWWGTSPQPAQTPNRQFLIRIFNDVQCRPSALVYSACVLATNQQVGYDCRDRRVYRFNANLPTGAAGFSQVAGTHYWLMIAEVDGTAGALQSPTLGAVDFEWSAHRNIKNCPALQRTPSGVFIQPLLDQCDNIEEDLSFVLYRSAIIVHVPTPLPTALTTLPRPNYIAEFRNMQGELVDTQCFSPDDDGSASLHPELAPGQYTVGIRGGSFRPSFFDIFIELPPIAGGSPDYFIDLGNVAVGRGDVDGDGDTDFADLTNVLSNWHP